MSFLVRSIGEAILSVCPTAGDVNYFLVFQSLASTVRTKEIENNPCVRVQLSGGFLRRI